VDLTFRAEGDRTVVKELEFEAPAGTATTLGNLPTFYVDFRSRRLGEGSASVGYLWFSAFLDPQRLMPKVTEAVTGFADCRGIIIDMRGNPGGLGAMAMGVAGHFIPEQQKLGEMVTRDGTMKFLIFPRARTFAGKVAILTDECSVSTAEILAGGMKDLGRARVFGTRTAGQALPSTVAKLPNGDGFQYAFANYISAGGRPLEGDGVTPDVEAPPTRAALLAGRDPALEAAREWILSDASEK
jgi:carboxyl-terminal processing protease